MSEHLRFWKISLGEALDRHTGTVPEPQYPRINQMCFTKLVHEARSLDVELKMLEVELEKELGVGKTTTTDYDTLSSFIRSSQAYNINAANEADKREYRTSLLEITCSAPQMNGKENTNLITSE